MTTYEDLTPYTYDDKSSAREKFLNVGWLGQGSIFTKGKADPRFRAALLRLVAFNSENQTRGFHFCELCADRVHWDMDRDDCPLYVPFDSTGSGTVTLGSAEIHVPGDPPIVYAAPTLIVHYVDAHDYLPPRIFVDSVLDWADSLDEEWSNAKKMFPFGTRTSVVVRENFVSEMVVTLENSPNIHAIAKVDRYVNNGTLTEPSNSPGQGEKIDAIVVGHSEERRQITLRVARVQVAHS